MNINLDIPSIISALAVIITAWLSYNQYRHNKMTDLKVDRMKRQEKQRTSQLSYSSGMVFGELWNILHQSKADRVYIVQPHPLKRSAFLTIRFEVLEDGVREMKHTIHSLPMERVPKFSQQMAEEQWMWLTDIDRQMVDRVAKSIMLSNGTEAVAVKRLTSPTDLWEGSIFCEFLTQTDIKEEQLRAVMHRAALKIQDNLPEVEEEEIN